jgi:hypothetical protein
MCLVGMTLQKLRQQNWDQYIFCNACVPYSGTGRAETSSHASKTRVFGGSAL